MKPEYKTVKFQMEETGGHSLPNGNNEWGPAVPRCPMGHAGGGGCGGRAGPVKSALEPEKFHSSLFYHTLRLHKPFL